MFFFLYILDEKKSDSEQLTGFTESAPSHYTPSRGIVIDKCELVSCHVFLSLPFSHNFYCIILIGKKSQLNSS